MISYLGHIVTLCAAVLAVTGETWDSKAKGFKKLTLTGRIAVIVILAGFVLSSISTYQEQERRKEAHRIASSEINHHWRALVHPFKMILWSIYDKDFGYNHVMLDKLLEQETIQKIKSLNIRDQAPHYHGMWLNVLSDSTKTGREGLDEASFKYNFILDQDLITAIHDVTTLYYIDALISSKVYSKPLHNINKNDSMSYPMPFGNLADEKFYIQYVNSLKKLKSLIDEHLDS